MYITKCTDRAMPSKTGVPDEIKATLQLRTVVGDAASQTRATKLGCGLSSGAIALHHEARY